MKSWEVYNYLQPPSSCPHYRCFMELCVWSQEALCSLTPVTLVNVEKDMMEAVKEKNPRCHVREMMGAG